MRGNLVAQIPWYSMGVGSILILALLVSGCMPYWSGRDLEDQVMEMEQRQEELDAEAKEREEALAAMIADAKTEIDELEEVLEEARSVLARNSADLGADVQQNRREISQLQGRIEEGEFYHRQLEQRFETFREDMDTRFDNMEAEELLEKVEGFEEDGDFGLARRALEQFLSDHDDHQLAGEARLMLGEIYFATEQWESAVPVFREVREDQRSSARQARATRRLGEVFWALEDCSNAQLFFETVVDVFPNSDEVDDAQSYLDDLAQGACP